VTRKWRGKRRKIEGSEGVCGHFRVCMCESGFCDGDDATKNGLGKTYEIEKER